MPRGTVLARRLGFLRRRRALVWLFVTRGITSGHPLRLVTVRTRRQEVR